MVSAIERRQRSELTFPYKYGGEEGGAVPWLEETGMVAEFADTKM